ncbi:MAG: endopeptidase La [Bacteroidales bacterium]|jgi:ATP-dependent Lon protease|nr:endopeptidase La [Bacteroidales bacterium]
MNEFINNESHFVPLFSLDDEEMLIKEKVPEQLPILPLRNTVLFPGMVIPITVGRNKSIKLAQDFARNIDPIGVVAQIDNDVEEPTVADVYSVGTMARILKFITMPDGSVTIIVQGIKRFNILEFTQTEPYIMAKVSEFESNDHQRKIVNLKTFKATISSIRDTAETMINLSQNIPREASFALNNIESPVFLINFMASNLSVSVEEKQTLLEIADVQIRAQTVLKLLHKDVQMAELKNQIQHKSKQEMDKQQREYYLNEQMKTIQQELGGSPAEQAANALGEKAKDKKWNKETKEMFDKELQKLHRTNPMSPDYSVQLNYLELLVDLPWNEYSADNFDMEHARQVLDKDHFGLEKVKERIIEYLAVLKLKGDMKSPILCLAGPPGVGKTSLGRSVADALDRKYVRISLGGLRDESEIRGHRKTYIGAMPGRIIQNIRKSGFSNPVFVLDEIDKVLGMNVQGDPSAALLEVLDPEQNSAFHDNYLETDFDLSRVLFIATANNLGNIHPALLDRMEIVDIAGYLIEEKISIAKKHLIPKQLKEHGMKDTEVVFSDEVIESIISDYTRESGVRTLEKTIAKIIRSRAAVLAQEGKLKQKTITPQDLHKILGAPIFQKERSIDNSVPGIATGLAWTSVGGEILFVESITSVGKEGLSMTGNLGDVMKESATIAYEYLKAHGAEYDLDSTIFAEKKVHIHVPEGATPKDGPSAGITILTSLISSFTQRKVRAKIAMTGEITLRGKLLPVGGIKEKILAAKRSGIYDIVLSSENKKDIEDVKENFIEGMKFHYFDSMKEAIDYTVLQN